MGWSGVLVAKKFDKTLWHEILHQLHNFYPFCTKFGKATKLSQMHPKSTKHTKTWVQVPMGWIGRVCCEKFRHDFVAWTFALVRPVLHEFRMATKQYRMLPNHTNAPKRQFRFQWGALSVFVVTEFRKATKRSRMHPNSTKRIKTSVYGAMGWIGWVRCEKFWRNFVTQTFALSRPVLHRVS